MTSPKDPLRSFTSRLTLLCCVVAAFLWCFFAEISLVPIAVIDEENERLSSQTPLLMKKPIIAICAPTRSMLNWTSLEDTKLQALFVPSIEQTIAPDELSKWDVRLYLGIDDDDQFWRIHHGLFPATLGLTNTSSWLTVTAAFFNKTKKHRIPFNELTGLAYDDGAEYIVRINDDTEFITHGWITMGTNTLLSYDPRNVGVVGPSCQQGNAGILTHDMVHRTHMDIFHHKYYPEVFDNWYLDDWISMVYGENRTTTLPDWEVHHHLAKPPRYEPNRYSRIFLGREIASGRKEILRFLSQERMEQKQTLHERVVSPAGMEQKSEFHKKKVSPERM